MNESLIDNHKINNPKGSLKKTLVMWFLILSLIPLLVVSIISYQASKKSLIEAAENDLLHSSDLSKSFINTWFEYRFMDVRVQAGSSNNRGFLTALINGLKEGNEIPEEYVTSSSWLKTVNEKDNDIISLSKNYDYIYNIYLIDLQGNILFSLKNNIGLGENLFIDENSQTLFSKSVVKSIKNGREYFSDLEMYPLSNTIMTGFLTSPMNDESGKLLGVFAMQILTDRVFSELQSIAHKNSSQIHYIIGDDETLRTNIYVQERKKYEVIYNIHDQHRMAGKTHDIGIVYTGLNGKKVFGIHNNLNVPGVKWRLVSEVNMSEVLLRAENLWMIIQLLFFITAVLVIIFSIFKSKQIIDPLAELLNASMNVAAGKDNVQVNINSNNEIGGLADAFNFMLRSRQSYEVELARRNVQLEKTLNELHEQKFALDQHAIVAITDVRGEILFINDKFSEISGYSKHELIGKNHRLLKSDYHSKDFFKKMFCHISSGNVWHGEICNRAKDGHIYWVDTTIVPFMDEKNKPINYIAIRTDITDIKKIEDHLIQAKNTAEDALVAKSQFLASMSHEIRTPMNGVLGMLGLLKRTRLDDNQKHRLAIAQSSAESLLKLIDDILDFSKIEAGKMNLDIIDFNLRTMLDEFVESIGFQAQEKNLELILDIKDVESSMVKGDPARLRQIFNNIVSNAIKFTEQGEIIIRVSLKEMSEKIFVMDCEIIDTGIGIEKEKLSTLFDTFSQVDASTTRKYGGTGLGLAIAKKLTVLMAGNISVSSEINVGSCFEFNIQLQKSHLSQKVHPYFDIKFLSILIVDNNNASRNIMHRQLSHWGAVVVEANSGQQAIEKCNEKYNTDKRVFDIVFVNMKMPEMDGVELCQSLKINSNFLQMKMIMMISMVHQEDSQFFATLGVDAYYPKPMTTSDLFSALSVVNDDSCTNEQAERLKMHHFFKISSSEEDVLIYPRDTNQWSDCFRILLVEDNKVNQIVAQEILETMGLNVDLANNGLQALQCLKSAGLDNPYRLILMDCQMPEMDGYEATRQIRLAKAGELNKSIIILAITANAMSGDREKCLSSGMDDYLSKPINPEHLLEKIRQWLPEFVNLSNSKVLDINPVNDIGADAALTHPSCFDDLQVWDKKSALKRIMGKQKLLDMLVDVFIKETPGRIKDLYNSLNANDFENIGLVAHTLKGVAANLSALRVQKQAGLLESAAKQNKQDIARFLLADLAYSIEEFTEYLSQEIQVSAIINTGGLPPLNNQDLQALLNTFQLRLIENEYIDEDELKPLQYASDQPHIKALLQKLFDKIVQIENEAALELIKKIRKVTNSGEISD